MIVWCAINVTKKNTIFYELIKAKKKTLTFSCLLWKIWWFKLTVSTKHLTLIFFIFLSFYGFFVHFVLIFVSTKTYHYVQNWGLFCFWKSVSELYRNLSCPIIYCFDCNFYFRIITIFIKCNWSASISYLWKVETPKIWKKGNLKCSLLENFMNLPFYFIPPS